MKFNLLAFFSLVILLLTTKIYAQTTASVVVNTTTVTRTIYSVSKSVWNKPSSNSRKGVQYYKDARGKYFSGYGSSKAPGLQASCGVDNFYFENLLAYTCFYPYRGEYPTNVYEMLNKKLVFYEGNYYYISCPHTFDGCRKSISNEYATIAEVFEEDINSLLPKLNNTDQLVVPTGISEPIGIFEDPLLHNHDEFINYVKRIMVENYCEKDKFFIDGEKFFCLEPFNNIYPTYINMLYEKIIISSKGEYFIINEILSNICDGNDKKDDCVKDIARISNLHDITYVVLEPRLYGVPSSSDERIYQKLYDYNGEFHRILSASFPGCSELDYDYVGCYFNIAKFLGENIYSNSTSNNDADKKIELIEYLCGKDDFHIKDGKYICLRPYGGTRTPYTRDMYNKRIIYYNEDHYILNLMYSNVCSLDIESTECYTDIANILGKDDFFSIYPRESIDNTGKDYKPEEIMDRYRCEGDFYAKDDIHICLIQISEEELPLYYGQDASLDYYISYNDHYYRVDTYFSSVEAIRVGRHPMINYLIFSDIFNLPPSSLNPHLRDFTESLLQMYDNQYYCKKNDYGEYFIRDDYYLCINRLFGEIPNTNEEAYKKLMIRYKNSYYTVNTSYSCIYVRLPKYDKSYENIAFVMGEEKESIMPNFNN